MSGSNLSALHIVCDAGSRFERGAGNFAFISINGKRSAHAPQAFDDRHDALQLSSQQVSPRRGASIRRRFYNVRLRFPSQARASMARGRIVVLAPAENESGLRSTPNNERPLAMREN